MSNLSSAQYGPYAGPVMPPEYRPMLPEALGQISMATAPLQGFLQDTPRPRPMATSAYDSVMVTTSIRAEIDSEGAVNYYEDVPIFRVGARDSLHDSMKNTECLLAGWDLNQKIIEETEKGVIKRKGRQDCLDAHVPTELSVAPDTVQFLGYTRASIEQNPDNSRSHFTHNSRLFTVQVQGEIQNVPNIWGQDVRIGQDVGFALVTKTVDTKRLRTSRKWDDSLRENDRIVSQVLQLVPMICDGGNVPLQHTFLEKHRTYDSKKITTFEIDMGGGVKVPEPVALELPLTFIPVGRVTRKDGVVSEGEIQDAMEKVSGYNMLKMRGSKVSLQLMHMGKRFKWCQ